jgi:hypothetical protein
MVGLVSVGLKHFPEKFQNVIRIPRGTFLGSLVNSHGVVLERKCKKGLCQSEACTIILDFKSLKISATIPHLL